MSVGVISHLDNPTLADIATGAKFMVVSAHLDQRHSTSATTDKVYEQLRANQVAAILASAKLLGWLAERVTHVVLDAPVIDWGDVIAHHAQVNGIPAPISGLSRALMGRRSARRTGAPSPAPPSGTWASRSSSAAGCSSARPALARRRSRKRSVSDTVSATRSPVRPTRLSRNIPRRDRRALLGEVRLVFRRCRFRVMQEGERYLKEAVKIPVIASNRINTPDVAEAAGQIRVDRVGGRS